MILWQKNMHKATIHAFDLPMSKGVEVRSLCDKVDADHFRPFLSRPVSDKGLCRVCIRRAAFIPRTSGDVDL